MTYSAADAAEIVASIDGDYHDETEAHLGAVVTQASDVRAVVSLAMRDDLGGDDTYFTITIVRTSS